jgi:hypothetical protein
VYYDPQHVKPTSVADTGKQNASDICHLYVSWLKICDKCFIKLTVIRHFRSLILVKGPQCFIGRL